MVSRRRWLQGAAALLIVRDALAAGKIEKGVYRVRGDARVNGVPAREGMDVKPGDAVTTAAGAEIVFVINRDAFLLRANSRVEVGSGAADVFRIVTGALLSVVSAGAGEDPARADRDHRHPRHGGLRGEQRRQDLCLYLLRRSGAGAAGRSGRARDGEDHATTSSRATSWRRARRR